MQFDIQDLDTKKILNVGLPIRLTLRASRPASGWHSVSVQNDIFSPINKMGSDLARDRDEGRVPLKLKGLLSAISSQTNTHFQCCKTDFNLLYATCQYPVDEAPTTLRSGLLIIRFVGSEIPPKRLALHPTI